MAFQAVKIRMARHSRLSIFRLVQIDGNASYSSYPSAILQRTVRVRILGRVGSRVDGQTKNRLSVFLLLHLQRCGYRASTYKYLYQ